MRRNLEPQRALGFRGFSPDRSGQNKQVPWAAFVPGRGTQKGYAVTFGTAFSWAWGSKQSGESVLLARTYARARVSGNQPQEVTSGGLNFCAWSCKAPSVYYYGGWDMGPGRNSADRYSDGQGRVHLYPNHERFWLGPSANHINRGREPGGGGWEGSAFAQGNAVTREARDQGRNQRGTRPALSPPFYYSTGPRFGCRRLDSPSQEGREI